MKKYRGAVALLLCFLVLTTGAAPANGDVFTTESSMVYMYNDVVDDAGVLSEQTIADVSTLNERADIRFTVATRHFLGGREAQSYCDELFNAWNLGSYDVLLLLVIGEERYAVTLGSDVTGYYLSSEQVNSLLSSKLRQPFLQDRDYDGAVGSFLLAAASQVARANGSTLYTGGLFGTASGSGSNTAVVQQDDFSNWRGNWWDGFFAGNGAEYADSYSGYDPEFDYGYSYEDDYEESFGFGKLIFLAIVLWIIIKNRQRNGKRGLGLFGWIVASKGMKEFSRTMNGVHRRPRPPRPPRR